MLIPDVEISPCTDVVGNRGDISCTMVGSIEQVLPEKPSALNNKVSTLGVGRTVDDRVRTLYSLYAMYPP